MKNRRPDRCEDWQDLASEWNVRPGTTYLNHGSFGLSPRIVREKRRNWIDELDAQPMDFYVRRLEPAMNEARDRAAQFLGTTRPNLVFVENATYGMNVVAESIQLKPGDEIVLNNHEYGAVERIWQRQAARFGAKVVPVQMPERFESAEQMLAPLLAATTAKTRLVVLSHITSPTALIWPVEKLIPAFRERGIPVCIDGPHAPAHIPLHLDSLDCDFYVASCHKWLCAPLGTGFVYAHPRQHAIMQPLVKSWGRLLPAVPERWHEEFTWQATRDTSGFLSIPTAIEFMESIGLHEFRARAYWLATYAEDRLVELTGERPLGDRRDGWYGTMAHVPLPAGDWSQLQNQLWQQFQIEIPIIHFNNRWFIRVSCHLYTTTKQIDYLLTALHKLGVTAHVVG
ncbi:MAG: aminotransferase class V-fold PLP-dependent enzyme [Pirellulaceae bacterium]